MALPHKYQDLAKRLGLTRFEGESDQKFISRIEALRQHTDLLREARNLGLSLSARIKTADLRHAICAREIELLNERGFVQDAKVKLGERIVEIREIVKTPGREPKVTVKYWILEPWTGRTNQGRANHVSAKDMLKKGQIIT